MMRVTFEFHGMLRPLAGVEQLQLELAAGSVAEALTRLCERQPALAAALDRSACAIGTELVTRDHPLRDDITLALIPPVSGG